MRADVDLDIGRKTFTSGLLPELISVLRRCRPVGSRLWLYTNSDSSPHCDYCCVRSSPTGPRRELGLARAQRMAREAAELGVKEIFVTGGEPFLLEDIGDILLSCAAAAPNMMLPSYTTY